MVSWEENAAGFRWHNLSSDLKAKKQRQPILVLRASGLKSFQSPGHLDVVLGQGSGQLEHHVLQMDLSMYKVVCIKPALRPGMLVFCLPVTTGQEEVRKGHTFPKDQPGFNTCLGVFATEGTPEAPSTQHGWAALRAG